MKQCYMKTCIFYYITILANLALIGFTLYVISNSYGSQIYTALFLLIPPLLSIIALGKGGDKEERVLKKRIRKAQLRKDLDDLKKFDTQDPI